MVSLYPNVEIFTCWADKEMCDGDREPAQEAGGQDQEGDAWAQVKSGIKTLINMFTPAAL